MQLSLSVRIAEAETKDRMTIGFEPFARLAKEKGYSAVCIRASAGGVQSSREELLAMRRVLDELGLRVSMVTTDFDVPRNNDHGPDNLRNIEPHLDVAECLGASLIRVCMKREEDIGAAARASDQARERSIRLAHQCHTNSLFETVDQIVDVLTRVGRENFGLIYEPANLMLCGQAYGEETLRRFAPWLMNVYVQNHRIAPDGPVRLPTRVRGEVRYHDIPLWEPGGVDFGAVFGGLKTIGYEAYVTVHQQFAKLMGPEEAASQSFAFLAAQIGTEEPSP
jgi:sugar phosphate isomerase/epimerase